MWTINGFPVYIVISGWGMHEKLACLYCMENNKAFMLTNDGKTSFFLLPTMILSNGSQVHKCDFFVGRPEKDVTLPLPSGDELYDVVSEYDDIVFGFQSGKQKYLDFGLTYKLVKQSIFWKFCY